MTDVELASIAVSDGLKELAIRLFCSLSKYVVLYSRVRPHQTASDRVRPVPQQAAPTSVEVAEIDHRAFPPPHPALGTSSAMLWAPQSPPSIARHAGPEAGKPRRHYGTTARSCAGI
ncbi:hypothetical protein GGF50DRAFT_121806 [Schizophyllum commune]